jgi:hypothetical protein
MSRLASLSPAALRAMFSPEADDSLMILMTITGSGVAAPVRLADSYTHKFEYLSSSQMTVTDIETQATSTYTYQSDDDVVQDAITEYITEDQTEPCAMSAAKYEAES